MASAETATDLAVSRAAEDDAVELRDSVIRDRILQADQLVLF